MSEDMVDKYASLSDLLLNEGVESISRYAQDVLYINMRNGRRVKIEAEGEATIIDGKIVVINKLKVELQI